MGFPLVYLVWMSLHRWSMVGFEPPRFVGLRNFVLLTEDARFTECSGPDLLVHRPRPRLQPAGRARHRAVDARALSRARHLPGAADPAHGGDAGGDGAGVGDHARPDAGHRALPARTASASPIRRCGCQRSRFGGADPGGRRCLDVDADGGADLHRRPRLAAARAVRGGDGRRRLGAAALPASHVPDDAADSDGGGDAAGDGPPEGDRHRLCHDGRRAGPSHRRRSTSTIISRHSPTTRSATARRSRWCCLRS